MKIFKHKRESSAQLRLGILLLEIETRRYTSIYDKHTKSSRKRHSSEKLCALCELGSSEDEVHFLLVYTIYLLIYTIPGFEIPLDRCYFDKQFYFFKIVKL